MRIKCEVIRDLLPLYVDEVASEESCELVEEHLTDCVDCREYCQLLREEPPKVSTGEYVDEAASLKKIKRRINRNRILLVAITLAFAIAAAIFLNKMNLAEYQGSLEENLSFKVPAGYELVESDASDDSNSAEYVRETDTTRERLLIYYDGLDGDRYFIDWKDPEKLDEITEYSFEQIDWDHSYDNELICYIIHGPESEAYEVRYQCQETDKKDYYSSCSKEQQEEILAFVKTFDFHRPSNEEVGNVFKRLYLNYGVAGLVILGLGILIFAGFPIGVGIGSLLRSDEKKKDSDSVVRSRDLLDSVNRERECRGETTIPSVNAVQGTSTNTLARRDHSWSSVPDFFIKMFRKK